MVLIPTTITCFKLIYVEEFAKNKELFTFFSILLILYISNTNVNRIA